ncbi:hypothetical protein [Falsiroseomonas oryziterrae]|uniref:hypothetical protein n=1 Tax=Falsiroseomonas oryziterrae TaxID=2911368 RepID=UPI001F44BC19|nr:hypothetical protein [Roseomonas sp. NPKOSM-4]
MRWLLPLLLLAVPAAAQSPPACTDARAGMAACLAGKLCLCGYQRGGIVSGRPDGWAWDCGVLRPPCGEALAPPGLLNPPQILPQLLLPLPDPPMTPWPR